MPLRAVNFLHVFVEISFPPGGEVALGALVTDTLVYSINVNLVGRNPQLKMWKNPQKRIFELIDGYRYNNIGFQ